ncbi:MAG: twitching motility protein PilT [Ardenticatenaceae bacterium]|nr:MAG: twitching motility protein PilT [Ardenticatenaceae bacterium]
MKIVADTNIFLAVALNEPEKDRIVEITKGFDAFCPEILPYEIANALSAMVKRKRISAEKVLAIYEITQEIPVQLVSTDILKSLEIAGRYNIYAYDAYFLQCALSLNCPLLTLDFGIKQVARQLGIKILE